MGAYEYLKALIAEAAEDVRKAERGNKAAGVRVRRIMHDAKSAAQDVRNVILNTRDLPREDATPR